MLLTLEKVAILKSADIFAKTPDYVLSSVAAIAEEVNLDPGETFIHKDTFGDDMYIIVEGEVRVHDGDKTIATLSKGEVVGEMEILSPAPRLVSASATTETRLFSIRKEAFDEVMADRYEIVQGVIRVLIQRLRAAIIKS
jgi:CRP-like cAMP-binding protein